MACGRFSFCAHLLTTSLGRWGRSICPLPFPMPLSLPLASHLPPRSLHVIPISTFYCSMTFRFPKPSSTQHSFFSPGFPGRLAKFPPHSVPISCQPNFRCRLPPSPFLIPAVSRLALAALSHSQGSFVLPGPSARRYASFLVGSKMPRTMKEPRNHEIFSNRLAAHLSPPHS